MFSKLTVFFTILFFFFSNPAFSQPIEKVVLKKYGLNDGLSSFNLRKIIQDKYGYIWIATQEGLDRFDGTRFINYSKSGAISQKLFGIDIREIIEDTSKGILWVLPGENGLNGIDLVTGKVIKQIPIVQQTHDDWNISMIKRQDDIYVATNNGIRVIDIKKAEAKKSLFNSPDDVKTGFQNNEVRTIKLDPFNNIWACYTKQGITIYNTGDKIIKANLFSKEYQHGLFIKNIEFINDTLALAATNTGLYKIRYSQNYHISLEKTGYKELANCDINDLKIFTSGQVYISSSNGLFVTDKRLTEFSKYADQKEDLKGDWLREIKNLSEDKQGNIWLSCMQGAAFISNLNRPFQNFYVNTKTGERLEHILGLSMLENGKLFICLSNGLAELNRNDNSFSYRFKNSAFFNVTEDPKGNIQVSTEKGIFLYKNSTLIPVADVYSEFKNYASFEINSHVVFNDSLLIMGTEKNHGILVWNFIGKTMKNLLKDDEDRSLSSNIINTVYMDRKKDLWVLSDYTIDIFDKKLKKIKTLHLKDPVNKQDLNLFFDVCESGDYYWITSYGAGLIKLNSNYEVVNVFDKKKGLSNEGVYQVFNSGGLIFVTSNNGLSVLDTATGKFTNYYESQGLHSNSFEEGAGFKMGGKIYAGGIKGFTIIDPAKIKVNSTPPKVYFRNIVIETQAEKIDTSDIKIEKLIVPNNAIQTTVYVSGINWNNPEHTSYQYRIKEQSSNWISLSTQNFITLIGLSPGTYHLQVKAANEDGIWSEPKELILIFEPKWYQTWWFKLLVFLTTAGIIYAFYRYRIRQIKKQHEIRKNIATDLHDDLGSTLNSVKVFTNLAISGVKQEESLQQVKDNLTEATMSLRDMIWVLDDSLDTVDELITRLKQFAIPVAAASNIEAIIKADSGVNSRQLTKEEKRNLFLICKEAINNSIKYSGASQIDVSISASGKRVQIVVADNGKGFNVEEVKKGYGLKNMQYRAGQIKYKVTLSSSAGKGTQIAILPS